MLPSFRKNENARFFISIFILIFIPPDLFAQSFPQLSFQKFYGKKADDIPSKLIKSADNQLIIGGTTEVINADGTRHTNVWLLKVDTMGHEVWERELFLRGSQHLRSLTSTHDGGVMFVGVTNSMITHEEKGDVAYWGDYFVGKVDSFGQVDWMNTYGGNELDQAYSVTQGRFEECVVVGSSHSQDGDVTNNFGMSDIWLLKLDLKGNKQFSKVMGGKGNDWATSIISCQNGDYLLAGFTNSPDIARQRLSIYGNGLLIRLNAAGETRWVKTFACPEGGYFMDLTEDEAGNLALVGYYGMEQKGEQFWFLKLTSQGERLSEHIFGSTVDERLMSVAPCAEGGYLLGGYAAYTPGEPLAKGGQDFWLMRTDRNGTPTWRSTLGGPNDEACRAVLEYRPGVLYALGDKYNDFVATRGPQAKDYWLVRIDEYPCDSLKASIFARNHRIGLNTRIRFKARHSFADRFLWDFGDGTTSTEENPLKSYSLAGMYNITLTVYANEGCSQKVRLEKPIIVN